MLFLVNFMNKAIQDNKICWLFLEKDWKVSRFHWRNPLLKFFILKYVKNAIFI